MLHALEPRHLRQIEHLPALGLNDRRLGEAPPATLATLDRMQHSTIRILATLQTMTLMARLPAGLAARAAAQTTLLVHRLLGVPI